MIQLRETGIIEIKSQNQMKSYKKHKEINKENIKIIRIIQQGNSNSSNFNLTKEERNKQIKQRKDNNKKGIIANRIIIQKQLKIILKYSVKKKSYQTILMS